MSRKEGYSRRGFFGGMNHYDNNGHKKGYSTRGFFGGWGQRHLRYLKEYRRVTYFNLLTSGRLNTYLAGIDKQAEELFFRLVEQMKQAQGITERLKEENALEWTGRMNNIQACAREILERESIYA